MSKIKSFFSAVLILATSCSFSAINIIPKPNEIKEVKGASFCITEQTGIRFSDDLKGEAKLLAKSIKNATGLELRLVPAKVRIALPSQILLTTDSKADSKEGYTLSVDSKKVVVSGSNATGVFYGTQSLLQLIPLDGKPVLPGCVIKDQPRFGWRGMHLDSVGAECTLMCHVTFTKLKILRLLSISLLFTK